MERLESEHDNFRAALEWCVDSQKTESALRLLGALGWPWEVRSHYSEARNWFEKIRSLPYVSKHPAAYANLLNHIGRHSWSQGNFREARLLLEESHAIALQLKTESELILAANLNWLGLLSHFAEQDDNKAKALFQQSLEIFEKWEDVRGMALSKFHLGIAEDGLHHEETAYAIFEQSLALFRELGDLFFIARVLEFLRLFHQRQGDPEKTRQFLDLHLEIDRKLQYWSGIVDALDILGDLLHQQGRHEEAERCRQESMSIRREHGLSTPI
jgi:tetratricopeptide (TPR) repeat protein